MVRSARQFGLGGAGVWPAQAWFGWFGALRAAGRFGSNGAARSGAIKVKRGSSRNLGRCGGALGR
eukprot:15446342-Alexandrium_andersonii.AAC.1